MSKPDAWEMILTRTTDRGVPLPMHDLCYKTGSGWGGTRCSVCTETGGSSNPVGGGSGAAGWVPGPVPVRSYEDQCVRCFGNGLLKNGGIVMY